VSVFISFVHEDQRVATAVQRYLNARLDVPVFLASDNWQVYRGEDWLARIRQELTAARVVVLMLSRRSVGRPWVNFEAGAAWLTSKPVIPACYGNLTKGNLPKPYSSFQGLNLRGESYYLLSSVAHYLGVVAPPPEPLSLSGESTAPTPTTGSSFDPTLARGRRALSSAMSIEAALQTFLDE
jgi:hypothetical protein